MSNFIPYGRQVIEDDDIASVVEVLKSDYLTCGPMVKTFEDGLKDYFQAAAAIAVSNGTAALHCALLALNIKPGDAVFLPANTFAASANSVLYCGGTPVFVDIEEDTRCLNPQQLEEAIALAKDHGLFPKAVILVHFGGLPGKILATSKICRQHQLALIEDACHAPGAEYTDESGNWLKVGSCHHSDFACFSFHPVKHIAVGEGGCITAKDPELAAKARLYSQHGITKDKSKFVSEHYQASDRGPWYYEMQALGYNYRLSDIQCALGVSQLKKMPYSVARRREIAAFYNEAFSKNPRIRPAQVEYSGSKNSYHLYVIELKNKCLADKAALIENLAEVGIGTQVHYIPIYNLPFYLSNSSLWLKVATPQTERHYQLSLSIPMWVGLGDDDLTNITEKIDALTDKILS
ncbi:MAG: UDP-4-amino-4,6-dideoxy-N-acetyl-beta-L-altrosamine transaminase [Oligoflexus sp.]